MFLQPPPLPRRKDSNRVSETTDAPPVRAVDETVDGLDSSVECLNASMGDFATSFRTVERYQAIRDLPPFSIRGEYFHVSN